MNQGLADDTELPSLGHNVTAGSSSDGSSWRGVVAGLQNLDNVLQEKLPPFTASDLSALLVLFVRTRCVMELIVPPGSGATKRIQLLLLTVRLLSISSGVEAKVFLLHECMGLLLVLARYVFKPNR